MKNYLSYPLSLPLFILYGCSQDPNLVTINGTIVNQVNDSVMLNFPDTSYQATLNSNGRFKIMFSQDSAQYATLIHGEMARLFLKPGDKVIPCCTHTLSVFACSRTSGFGVALAIAARAVVLRTRARAVARSS